jgi:hypothetical protein
MFVVVFLDKMFEISFRFTGTNIISLLILFYYLNNSQFKYDLIQEIIWNAIN